MIKIQRSLRAARGEVRVLSPFSLTLSLFSAMWFASRSFLFLSLLDSFYSRLLATSATWRKLHLWPRARGDISSFSSSIFPSLLTRRSSRTCLSFHRSTFGVASQLATSHILYRALSIRVTPFSSAYINTLPNFLSASLVKLNDSDGLTQTISQSPSTLMSRISTYFANFFFFIETVILVNLFLGKK